VLGFLGPNGAGKSTTMRILTGYLGATSGTASIAGFDVFAQSLEVRRRVGYLPETTPLYNEMRVGAFLDLMCRLRGVPPSQRRERVDDAIEACGLADRRAEVIARLSRGLRQRVGLAQAIVHDPEVLILDEPTAALDARAEFEVFQRFKELSAGKTAILISHRFSSVRMADRILVLADGKVEAAGTHEELVRQSGRYAELFELQAAGYR
jgi:ABC-2 type transport system ATP-binding protein